jgi:uncharacterized protein YlzI (FlbEa/FlbD family)
MLVYSENQKEAFEIFKNTCDNSQYVSFDCEMTGLNLGTKTDGTKYDTQEFRYYKQKEVVSKLDLIQIGFTFYQEKKKNIEKDKENDDKNDDKKEIIEKKYYLERTFIFYLYKNSKLKLINEDLFDSELKAHPASLKFLNESHFDFNILIKKGIHFNKLLNKNKIEQALNDKKILLSNGAMFLSKENESKLIDKIISLTEYILNGKNDKPLEIFFDNKRIMIFFLGCNFKKLLCCDGFIITKSTNQENTIIVQKKENSTLTKAFNDKYNSFDNFKIAIKNDPNKIYECRYQLGCFNKDENKIKELVENELGFSLYIDYLCKKKIPIIGHNIYYDMMFLYDKLIGDLPDDFYTFKKQIHEYFPYIYDTKYISTILTKKYKKCNIEKTNLDNVYKTVIKNKYDTYIDFFPDAPNGFCLYNDMERDKLHDAGYDSIITGRSFILLNKALENSFEIIDISKSNLGIGDNIKNQQNEKTINRGFADKDIFNQYINKTFMSLVEYDNGIINWNVGENGQTKEEYEKGEKELIEDSFKNVFMVKFKIPEDGHIINIYEIAEKFENDDYDICIVKTDYFSAFIEIGCDDYDHETDYPKILELIKNIKKNNEKLIVEEVYDTKNFYENFKNIIKFDF